MGLKGKRGPKPERIEEVQERENDPTAEEIVGAENVVSLAEEIGDNVEFTEEELRPQGYHCANCTFTSNLLSEMEEHSNGTGHGKFDTAPVQPELFSTVGVVHKSIEVPIHVDALNMKRMQLAEFYQQSLNIKEEKKNTDADCNARLKAIDDLMQAIARVLAKPFVYETVDCEWSIVDGENKRELRRLDTGEVVETAPLTGEDRAKELDAAAEANAEPEVEAEEELVN